jgi:putative ATPase
MAEPGFYKPVNRGLEIKIAEKLEQLKRRNQAQKVNSIPMRT